MAWYNSTGKENHKSLFDNVEYDRCIFAVGQEPRSLEPILQLCFQSLNITPVQFVRLVIQRTPNK